MESEKRSALEMEKGKKRKAVETELERMNELKKEKEDLMKQVDVEEDHITNTLLKKLDAVGCWLL